MHAEGASTSAVLLPSSVRNFADRGAGAPHVETLVELMRIRATTDPDLRFLTFLERGEVETETLNARETEIKARAVAVRLAQTLAVGDRALLFFGPGLNFTLGYWGCLFAGVVAVPVPSPGARAVESGPRIKSVAAHCGARALLTTLDFVPQVEEIQRADPALAGLDLIAVDAVDDSLGECWEPPAIDASSLTHLQYSSGSTGAPKGVALTHGNVLSNLDEIWGVAVDRTLSSPYGDQGVTWLPMFHDMGLVLGAFLPVFAGRPLWFMSPMAFLQQPLRWLRAVSQLHATLTAAPNFALDLAVERTTPDERRELDLSNLRAMCIGSEPVRYESLRRFADAFEPAGFNPNAFMPSYGLAEATLMVSGGPVGSGVARFPADPEELAHGRAVHSEDERALPIVACGAVPTGVRLAIVDPETMQRRADGEVGEIVIAGPGVGSGYWNDPETTAETFGIAIPGSDEPFMRTGDLGFLLDGQLYVTGRRKEVLIVNGQNHYPQDLELTASKSHPAIRAGRCIAFVTDDEQRPRVVLVSEVNRRELKHEHGGEAKIASAVRQAISIQHGLRVDDVVLTRRVPLTSSGKLRRTTCRVLYEQGAFANGTATSRGGARGA
jgi:acyl-CoA synthetase (AMP-forming)/AMP-acid ligase II